MEEPQAIPEEVNKQSDQDKDSGDAKVEASPRAPKISGSGIMGIIAAVLMCTAFAFALFPWIELSPALLQGVSMLSGLVSAFGDGSVSIPILSSTYSVFSLIDLAQMLSRLSAVLQALGDSASIISVSQDVVKVLDQIVVALYVVVALWAMALLVSVVGVVRCLVSRGRSTGVLVIGAAFLFGVSATWACTYNVALSFVAGANSVLAGVSLFSILCGSLCVLAWLCCLVSLILVCKKCTLPGDSQVVGHPNLRKKTKRTVVAFIVASVLIAIVVVYGVTSAVTGFPFKGLQFNQSASTTAKPTTSASSSGSGSSAYLNKTEIANLVAATVDGAELSEEAIVDYIDEFRLSAGASSNGNWREWMADNNYTAEAVRQEVIDSFINQYLVDLACEESGIEIADAQIANALAEVKSQFEEGKFEDSLTENNMTEEFYVQNVIIPALQRDALMKKVIKESPETEEEADEIFQAWLEKERDNHDIVINPMPLGLPYDV